MAASGVVGELARARIALDERGQRLGELEERTALMMTSAEAFSKHAHEVIMFRVEWLYLSLCSDMVSGFVSNIQSAKDSWTVGQLNLICCSTE